MSRTPDDPSRDAVLEDLPFHLARTGMAFRRLNTGSLKPRAPGSASVLHTLEELDDRTVNRLVERTHLPNGALAGLLDTLGRDSCVKRIRKPDDGRSCRIRLTKNGRELCAKLQRRHRFVMGMFHDLLSDAGTTELKRPIAPINSRMRAWRGGAKTA